MSKSWKWKQTIFYDNDSIKQSLAAGNPAVLMGQDNAGDRTPFAENPHYVDTATGIG